MIQEGEFVFCRCGCGAKFIPSKATRCRINQGKPLGYLPGHAHKGIRNPRWNDRKTMTASGYKLVYMPEHPNSRKSGYILEHRLVMSNHLGRPLEPDEDVHHRNENKTDNRIENLEVLKHTSHVSMHSLASNGNKGAKAPKTCPTCGKIFVKKTNHSRDKFCCKKCAKYSVPKGEDHHASKITPSDVRSIRLRASSGETHQAIADSYGIDRGTVSKIVRRERWSHVV